MDYARTYTHLEMEAALCIWESLEARSQDEKEYPAVKAFRDNYGTAEFRSMAVLLVPYCLAVYDAMPKHLVEGFAYDWDVIPAILDSVDWRTMPTLPEVEHGVTVTRKALADLRRERRPVGKTKDTVPKNPGAPVMPPATLRKRALPFKLFKERFQPIARQHGEIARDLTDLPADPLDRQWWTLETGNLSETWYLRPGIFYRVGTQYVRCRNPWGGEAHQHPPYVYG